MSYSQTESGFKRLKSAREYSFRKLAWARQKRLELIREYVGFHYGERSLACGDRRPANMLKLTCDIYGRLLVAKNPRCMISTPYLWLKPVAAMLELAVNKRIQELEIGLTARRICMEALMSPVGIAKIMLEANGSVMAGDQSYDVGQPFVDLITMDNFVYDTCAENLKDAAFVGNKFRLPLDYVQKSDFYDKTETAKLMACKVKSVDNQGNERASGISFDGELTEDYMDYVDLWDIYLPHEGIMMTIADQGGDKPLRVEQWSGPDTGPYKFLGFSEVPSNALYAPPANDWLDLNELTNSLLNKMGDQAQRLKRVGLYRPGAGGADAEKIKNASDGEMVSSIDPNAYREVVMGGVDQKTLAFFDYIKKFSSYRANNLESIGGLGATADTLGQEKLIAQSDNKQIADMQDRTTDFVRKIVRDLAWYEFTDPLFEKYLVMNVPHTDVQVPVKFSQDNKKGDWLDFNIDIDVYSMQHQTPQTRLQSLQHVMANYLLPMAGPLKEQGMTVNFEAFLKQVGKLADMPDLETLITYADGPHADGPIGDLPASGPKPKSPPKHYTHQTIPNESSNSMMDMMNESEPMQEANNS